MDREVLACKIFDLANEALRGEQDLPAAVLLAFAGALMAENERVLGYWFGIGRHLAKEALTDAQAELRRREDQ